TLFRSPNNIVGPYLHQHHWCRNIISPVFPRKNSGDTMTSRSSHSYSEKLECRHCHNIAPMRVVGDVADTTVEHLAGSPPIEHGTIYEVLSCPKCEQVTRSEERRVGKESGSRRTAQHERRHL